MSVTVTLLSITAAVTLMAFSKKLTASRPVITGWSLLATSVTVSTRPVLVCWSVSGSVNCVVLLCPASVTVTVAVRSPEVGLSVLLT